VRGKERVLAALAGGAIPNSLKPKSAEERNTKDLLHVLTRQFEAELEDLQKVEPKIPQRTEIFFANATPEGLVKELSSGYPIGALWDDEAGNVIGSAGMNEERILGMLSTINKLWDTSPIKHTRATIEDREASGIRFTINLMMQGAVLQKLASMEGGLARHSGFLARILLCEPPSTMGTRFYRPPAETRAVEAFAARSRALMEKDLPWSNHDPNSIDPPVIDLSPEAREIWRAYHDEVEAELKESGDFFEVRDFASKSAEQAARIAGCFHIWLGYGPEELLSAELMNRAKTIAAWYLMETLRVMNVRSAPQELSDAERLLAWMIEKGEREYQRNTIAKTGPYAMQKYRDRRDAAICELVKAKIIREVKTGNNAVVYQLNPKVRGA
jgi:putative DNA primase/helicase